MKIKHKKKKFIFKEKTTLDCSCCKKPYKIFAGTQAYRCASYFYKQDDHYAIVCEYGSGFDTTKFNVINENIVNERQVEAINKFIINRKKGLPGDDRGSLVCDKCIEKYLVNKDIVQDEEYNHFAILDELTGFYNEDPQNYFEVMSAGPEKCVNLMHEQKAESRKNLDSS